MLQLTTFYAYDLNKTVGICKDDKNVKRIKSDPSLARLFQRDQTCRHGNRKGINLNNYLKDDLPNALTT